MIVKAYFDMRDAVTDIDLDETTEEQFQALKRLLIQYVKGDTMTLEFDTEQGTITAIKAQGQDA